MIFHSSIDCQANLDVSTLKALFYIWWCDWYNWEGIFFISINEKKNPNLLYLSYEASF